MLGACAPKCTSVAILAQVSSTLKLNIKQEIKILSSNIRDRESLSKLLCLCYSILMAAGMYSLGKSQLRALRKISSGIVSIFDIRELERKNAERTLRALEEKGLVIRLGGDVVELSKKGQELLKTLAIEEISLEKPKNWDGLWHLICYDIPEFKKSERGYFQRKIRDLGFKKIQNSLWVYPYDCKEEIAIFAESLGVNNFVIYLNTETLPQESKLRDFYGLPIEVEEK